MVLTALLAASVGQDQSVKVESTLSQSDHLAHYLKPRCPAGIHLQHAIVVQLRALIDVNGRVRDVEFVKGDSRFREEALRAVNAWRYKPALVPGAKVEVKAVMELTFSCPGKM